MSEEKVTTNTRKTRANKWSDSRWK